LPAKRNLLVSFSLLFTVLTNDLLLNTRWNSAVSREFHRESCFTLRCRPEVSGVSEHLA